MPSELCKLDGQSPLHVGSPRNPGTDLVAVDMRRRPEKGFADRETIPKKPQNGGDSLTGSVAKSVTELLTGSQSPLAGPSGGRSNQAGPLDYPPRPGLYTAPSRRNAPVMPKTRRDHWMPRIDLITSPPDARLVDQIDPQLAIKFAVLPWRQIDDTIFVAVPEITPDHSLRATLSAAGIDTRLTIRPVLAPRHAIQDIIASHHRETLTRRMATRVPAALSCRTWARQGPKRIGIFLTLLALATLLIAVLPAQSLAALCLWSAFTLVVALVLKTCAAIACLTKPDPAIPPDPTKRPVISIIVPLFRERRIAEMLIKRLERLDYPRSKLDVVLVLEECDTLTRAALDDIDLPDWMRLITAPDGHPRTKPRAMNYALDFCRGSIIGVYDAEDAPAPDQLHRVADSFANAPPDLVCFQGALDYYNPRQNWIARCFTVEYNTWFRLVLPGMARLGLALPLGGTTFFFRRGALEHLGGWDAHNVTEDADLGFRLARAGYRSDVLPTTTQEEANCHAIPWIKQRSRWLKGYIVTYLVHMRHPFRLWRDLGTRRFIGFQAHFVTALSQFSLAPFLWSFWLIPLGLPHPVTGIIGQNGVIALGMTFLLAELLTATLGVIATRGRAHRHLWPYVPSLHFYWPLGFVAMIKALAELIINPFYWDKTQHGLSLPQTAPHSRTRPPLQTKGRPDTESRVRAAQQVRDRIRSHRLAQGTGVQL